MRSLGNTKKTITATPRQLESMIRLSEAIAKMRLSHEVEKQDLDEAIRLIKHAMQQAATDPNTGQINMDIITTGVTKTSSDRLNAIKEFIINLQVSFFLFLKYLILIVALERIQEQSAKHWSQVRKFIRFHPVKERKWKCLGTG